MIDFSNYWSDQKSAYQNALSYINGRKQGRIKSFRTPWARVNDAGVDGFEWHSMTVIGGRPGSGKTLIKDQIVREAFANNKGQNIRVLEFQLEMVALASKVREFSSVISKPYKYICSADDNDKLTQKDFDILLEHAKKQVSIDMTPVDIVEEAVTVEIFKAIVEQYMKTHSQEVNGVLEYTNTVVTLDHSILLKQSKQHKSKTEMLYELGEVLTALKRKYPIVFIILSQLGRDTESPERNENGKYGNYILETDMFGGDALFQHADMVIGVNRPGPKSIDYYGPERYIVDSDSLLIFHFLKVRNGDTRMSFFDAEFERMCVTERLVPPAKQSKLTTTS